MSTETPPETNPPPSSDKPPEKNPEKKPEKPGKSEFPVSGKERLATRGYAIVGKPISSGSFASVYKATRKGEPCAVKLLDLSQLDGNNSGYRVKFLPRELYTLKKLHHPYMVNVYDIFTIDGTWVVIFMELAEGGDLLDLLAREPPWLTEARSGGLFRQFGDAVRYMHSHQFAHRDIKGENILLAKVKGGVTVAKLADFGFARSCLDAQSGGRLLAGTCCGTTAYMAPEVLTGAPYSPMAYDVWSCGVVLFELLNNRLPFDNEQNGTQWLLKRMMARKYSFRNQTVSAAVRDLIGLLLTPDPQERPTMQEVFAHKWVVTGRPSLPRTTGNK